MEFEDDDEDECKAQHGIYDHEHLEMQKPRHAFGRNAIGAGVPPTSGIVRFLAQPRRWLGGADRVAPQAPGKKPALDH
jgi:hypothetical protein